MLAVAAKRSGWSIVSWRSPLGVARYAYDPLGPFGRRLGMATVVIVDDGHGGGVLAEYVRSDPAWPTTSLVDRDTPGRSAASIKPCSLTPTRTAGFRNAGDYVPLLRACHLPLMAWTSRMTSSRIDFGCRTNQRRRSAPAMKRRAAMNAVTPGDCVSVVLTAVERSEMRMGVACFRAQKRPA